MKFTAFILSLVVIIFVSEQFQIPSMITAKTPEKGCCKKETNKCNKKTPCKSANRCDGTMCINCPMGSLFTFQSLQKRNLFDLNNEIQFSPLKVNIVSGVNNKVWRPPIDC